MPVPAVVFLLARAQVALARGHDAEAGERAHAAFPIAQEHGFVPFVIDALEVLAVVLSQRGLDQPAARLLGAADSARERTGYKGSIFAGWLDIESIRDAARPTDAYAEGLALDLDAAVEYAQRSRGERGRPSHGWGSLTPTERQVADLVAEGLTNQQIATKLLMGVATVKSHLTHIFTKLNITNRAALAATHPK